MPQHINGKPRAVDESTMVWWAKRPEYLEQRRKWSNGVTLTAMLNQLSMFMYDVDGVWAKPPAFGLAILSDAYKQVKPEVGKAWSHNIEFCARTALITCPEARELDFEGDKHNALADAQHQAKAVKAAFPHLAAR